MGYKRVRLPLREETLERLRRVCRDLACSEQTACQIALDAGMKVLDDQVQRHPSVLAEAEKAAELFRLWDATSGSGQCELPITNEESASPSPSPTRSLVATAVAVPTSTPSEPTPCEQRENSGAGCASAEVASPTSAT